MTLVEGMAAHLPITTDILLGDRVLARFIIMRHFAQKFARK